MYIAPLTYDRFFKKIFNDDFIAQSFLEDLLDVEITEFQKAKLNHRITDDVALIKFDYRCKINGQYVIIDIQQWDKQDIVKRFFAYHCANTVVQLEQTPWANTISTLTETSDLVDEEPSTYEIENSKTQKDYNYITPVLTIIWMVHDTLGFKSDFQKYALAPQEVFELATKDELWQIGNEELLVEQRKKALVALGNNKKQLPFLRQNQLFFAFQRNIVKNKRLQKRYFPWFDLAYKSLNPNNKKNDFTPYLKHPALMKVIRRLQKIISMPGEIVFMEKVRQYEAVKAMERHKVLEEITEAKEQKAKAEKQKAEAEKRKIEAEKQKAEAEKQKIEAEKQKAKAEKQKIEAEKQAEAISEKAILALHQKGFNAIEIAGMLEIPVKGVQVIIYA